ncbi:helix-turn-helix protein [Luteibacter sp. OK325]|uniref:AraC family transcriptional regulator n=1 Tax=Luteibacter sp. OK325 TaxID=2135670 RepID=UPI000D3D6808|nr:AraC family transcriptional regulator [Luteibacter sp. OK325]PTR34173.1 helix-turn-helix protein [Luteibacter sp. OK325]
MIPELTQSLLRHTDGRDPYGPYLTDVPGLVLLRSDHEKPPAHLIFKPALCIVVQGAKWAVFGDRHLDYRAGQALIVSVETPALGRVVEASPTEPFLGIIIEFDLAIMREVADALGTPAPGGEGPGFGVFVTDFDGPLADCTVRLVRLLDTPQAIALLQPAIMREIAYWLLSGPHRAEVARMVLANTHAHRVITAIHRLRDRFAEPVRIDDLAAGAQMSTSAFHRQFRRLTAMTPLQYQKQLRLLEARRLMVGEAASAETAAFAVGYESASQFSREYSRMFGLPPRRDAKLLQQA